MCLKAVGRHFFGAVFCAAVGTAFRIEVTRLSGLHIRSPIEKCAKHREKVPLVLNNAVRDHINEGLMQSLLW